MSEHQLCQDFTSRKADLLHARFEGRKSSLTVKPVVIFNPRAGSIENAQETMSLFNNLKPARILITRKKGDAAKWAHQIIRSGGRYIIAAGGDGTLNEVVDGTARANLPTRIGLLPLGTGNDFARTLDLPSSVEENINILRAGKSRALDLVHVRSKRGRYFVNVSAAGVGGDVAQKNI